MLVAAAAPRPRCPLRWSPAARLCGGDSSAGCAGGTCGAARREPALAPLPAPQGCACPQ